jgi:hypothetical protein
MKNLVAFESHVTIQGFDVQTMRAATFDTTPTVPLN